MLRVCEEVDHERYHLHHAIFHAQTMVDSYEAKSSQGTALSCLPATWSPLKSSRILFSLGRLRHGNPTRPRATIASLSMAKRYGRHSHGLHVYILRLSMEYDDMMWFCSHWYPGFSIDMARPEKRLILLITRSNPVVWSKRCIRLDPLIESRAFPSSEATLRYSLTTRFIPLLKLYTQQGTAE